MKIKEAKEGKSSQRSYLVEIAASDVTFFVVHEGPDGRRADVQTDDELLRRAADDVDALEQHDGGFFSEIRPEKTLNHFLHRFS